MLRPIQRLQNSVPKLFVSFQLARVKHYYSCSQIYGLRPPVLKFMACDPLPKTLNTCGPLLINRIVQYHGGAVC